MEKLEINQQDQGFAYQVDYLFVCKDCFFSLQCLLPFTL